MTANFRAVVLFVTAVLSACGGGGGGDGGGTGAGGNANQNEIAASAAIGIDGGVVSVIDPSSPLFGVSVAIPPGALATEAQITIRNVPQPPQSSALAIAGPVVDFGPDGLTFQKPVVITLPGSPEFLEDSLIYVYSGGAWTVASSSTGEEEQESHGQSIDRDRNTISTTTTHFTPFGRGLDPEVTAIMIHARFLVKPPSLFQRFFDVPLAGVQYFKRTDLSGAKRCNCPDRTKETIKKIIIHSTDDAPNTPFRGLINWVKNMNVITGPDAGKGFAHYYIDSDGVIVQIVPDLIRAPHAAQHDEDAIGIELFRPRLVVDDATKVSFGDYTEQQLIALTQLTHYLMRGYSISGDGVVRHKDVAKNGKGDPYGWEESDWQRFRTLVTPMTNAWTGMALPYKRIFETEAGCQLVVRLDADGSVWRGGDLTIFPCVLPIEKKTNDLRQGYGFEWTGIAATTISGDPDFKMTAFNTRVVSGSLALDPMVRRAEFVSKMHRMKARCAERQISSSFGASFEAGTLSINGESVSLVLPSGETKSMGSLPTPTASHPMQEGYFQLRRGLTGADASGASVRIQFDEGNGLWAIWWPTGTSERRCEVNAP